MFNILVNATALDSRGGFSVVDSFLNQIKTNNRYLLENDIHLKVLVAVEELTKYSSTNISIIYEPYPKKSMFSKWRFERLILPKLISLHKIDAYLSLQHYGLKNINIPQYALIHQAIPFSRLKFNELEIKNYLKYKVIMNFIFKRSLNDLKGIFVQSNWVKEEIAKKYNYNKPIHVYRPLINSLYNNNRPLKKQLHEEFDRPETKIIYLTSKEKYKNIDRLLQAVNQYNNLKNTKIVLYLTIDGKSTNNIRYIGKIPYNSIYTIYQKVDALIFPSLVETLGLPILEATTSNINIIAPNLEYAKEVCGDETIYFDPRDVQSIVNAISNFINLKGSEIKKFNPNKEVKNDNYIEYLKVIYEENNSTRESTINDRVK